jgi:hypothetical protein
MREQAIEKLMEKEEIYNNLMNMVNSAGWDVVKKSILSECESLDDKINKSEEPNEVFSCVKQKNGILFVLREVNRLIEEGKSAANKLRSLQA